MRSKRPTSPTSRKPTGAGGAPRSPVKVLLDPCLAARLRAYAGWSGESVSDVVASLIAAKLRGFKVYQAEPASRGDVVKGGTVDLGGIDDVT